MKRFFLLLILICCMYRVANAQSNSPAHKVKNAISISVSANVISSIKIVTLQDIRFKHVSPQQKSFFISPIKNDNAGEMKAIGEPNAQVKITFFPNSRIQNTQSKSYINFKYIVSVNSQNDASTSELIQSDSRTFQMNSNGELFIWVGGEANINNIQPGNYIGDFNLQIEYI